MFSTVLRCKLPLKQQSGELRFARTVGLFSSFIMADEEVIDPKKLLEERCKSKCVKFLLDYQRCVERIKGDETGHKHCTGQYFDYWHCVDACVAPLLFSKLK